MNNKPTLDAAKLLDAIKGGRTLYIRTALRSTQITARTIAKFDAAGVPVLKNDHLGHLYLAEGRRYVDCTYTKITLV